MNEIEFQAHQREIHRDEECKRDLSDGIAGLTMPCFDGVHHFMRLSANMIIVETIPRMNKTTNPNCIHSSSVGFFQFILEEPLSSPSIRTLSLRNAAEGCIDRHFPFWQGAIPECMPDSGCARTRALTVMRLRTVPY